MCKQSDRLQIGAFLSSACGHGKAMFNPCLHFSYWSWIKFASLQSKVPIRQPVGYGSLHQMDILCPEYPQMSGERQGMGLVACSRTKPNSPFVTSLYQVFPRRPTFCSEGWLAEELLFSVMGLFDCHFTVLCTDPIAVAKRRVNEWMGGGRGLWCTWFPWAVFLPWPREFRV